MQYVIIRLERVLLRMTNTAVGSRSLMSHDISQICFNSNHILIDQFNIESRNILDRSISRQDFMEFSRQTCSLKTNFLKRDM